jgi:hypothetical protein
MKKLILSVLVSGIGLATLAQAAEAQSRYCRYNPDDPDCYGERYGDDYDYDRRDHYDDDPGYDEPDDFYRPRRRYVRPSRCEELAHVLRSYGYRRVRAIDCGGKNYKYVGFRRGQRYVLKVKARTGRIIYEIAN